MLKGVIFDIDGTLVDSNDAHAESWVDTFAEAGYDVPFAVVRPLIGMGAGGYSAADLQALYNDPPIAGKGEGEVIAILGAGDAPDPANS